MKFLALLISLAVPVHGWYPAACCSGQDCQPVACDELTEGTNGEWFWHKVVFSADKVRPSQDRQCHICLGKSLHTQGPLTIEQTHPRCLFILQGT